MKLEIDDELYAAIMSSLRVLEREHPADPRYSYTRKLLLHSMMDAATQEVTLEKDMS